MRSYCEEPVRAHRGRGPPPSGSGHRLDHHMGIIVKFPDDGRIVRFGRAEAADESATVIILPVVRIERHDEVIAADDVEPLIPPPAENGGRRRIRRR
jgi:hypothetical protein